MAFLIALKCGLRSNELEWSKLEDKDFGNLVIMLLGAANKHRKNRMASDPSSLTTYLCD
ncbi:MULTISPECIES: hypothetical protein [Bacillus]|uniref:hypothetical protein n=1 Tax=Bacillus TaxID=1386 RepID=UPI001CB8EE0C|nr:MULTISPECIES: hypothetical protein [Bacillus]UXO87562.1 hypothetical protein N7921_16795 [Bacillus safensis]WCL58176.1 hypothetical protein PNF30_03195 [Bacillus safensis]